jgi:hypothetical protein
MIVVVVENFVHADPAIAVAQLSQLVVGDIDAGSNVIGTCGIRIFPSGS